jgi:hypothetical protein
VTAFNILLGILPTLALAGSIAAGVDDDRQHRRMFALVYGLWAVTLAMWNWMRGYHPAWIAVWALFGIAALIGAAASSRRQRRRS